MDQNLPTQIDLTIVTPERPVVHERALAVSIPGKGGYLGILPGHAPLLTELKPGELAYAVANMTHYVAVSWGFAEVLPDRVIILAHTSERAEEIDVERARRAWQRALERLSKPSDPEVDRERAQAALERASARLEVANRAAEVKR
jgi:F-type H+-transporting ATPase subunit epsilon